MYMILIWFKYRYWYLTSWFLLFSKPYLSDPLMKSSIQSPVFDPTYYLSYWCSSSIAETSQIRQLPRSIHVYWETSRTVPDNIYFFGSRSTGDSTLPCYSSCDAWLQPSQPWTSNSSCTSWIVQKFVQGRHCTNKCTSATCSFRVNTKLKVKRKYLAFILLL